MCIGSFIESSDWPSSWWFRLVIGRLANFALSIASAVNLQVITFLIPVTNSFDLLQLNPRHPSPSNMDLDCEMHLSSHLNPPFASNFLHVFSLILTYHNSIVELPILQSS